MALSSSYLTESLSHMAWGCGVGLRKSSITMSSVMPSSNLRTGQLSYVTWQFGEIPDI